MVADDRYFFLILLNQLVEIQVALGSAASPRSVAEQFAENEPLAGIANRAKRQKHHPD